MTKLRSISTRAGFTLVESVVAAAVGTIILAGLALGAVSLSRSSQAVESFSDDIISQSRILDYLSRDVRRALTVAVTANPTKLTVTVADQYAATAPLRTFKVPTVSLANANYGNTPLTVSYYISGGNFVRQENGVSSIITLNVSDFEPVFDTSDPSGKTVKFSLTFMPAFKTKSDVTARTGTKMTASAKVRNL